MEYAENGNKVMKDRIFEGEKNLDLLDEKLREVKMASKELDDLMQTLRYRLQRSLLIDKKYALYRNRYILRTGEIPSSDLLENPYIDVEYVKEEESEGMNQGEQVEEHGEEEEANNYHNNEEMNSNEEVKEEMNHHEEIDVEVNHEGDIELKKNENNNEEMSTNEVEDSNSAIPEEETQGSDPSEPTIEPPSPMDEPELDENDDSAMMGTPFPEPPAIEEDPVPEEYEEEYDEGENRDSYDDYDEANEDYHESYDDYDYENDEYGRYDDEDDPYNSDHFDESEETKVISDDQLRFSVEISALPSLDDVNSIDVFVFIHPFIHFLL